MAVAVLTAGVLMMPFVVACRVTRWGFARLHKVLVSLVENA